MVGRRLREGWWEVAGRVETRGTSVTKDYSATWPAGAYIRGLKFGVRIGRREIFFWEFNISFTENATSYEISDSILIYLGGFDRKSNNIVK